MKFLNVFPTTISTFKIDNFNNEFLNVAKKSVSSNSKSSDDTNVLDMPIFSDVKKQILNSSEKFTKKVWGLDLVSPTISCSWFTKLCKGDSITPHRHMHAHLTGVFYLTSGSEICFQNPCEPPSIMPDIVNYNNCYQHFIKPKKGLCVIFSSSLYHSVYQDSDKPRYSIAFNINPTGIIGHKLAKITIS